jgi:hypothetical protein
MFALEMTPPPGPSRHPITKQFAPRYDPLSLFAVLRAVCAVAAAPTGKPIVALTQDDYDDARGAAGFADSKRAHRIVRQLGIPWSKLLTMVADEGGAFTQTLNASAWRVRTKLTDELIATALRVIALRLGAATLRPRQYDDERNQMAREDAARWLHGRLLDDEFPTSSQIDSQLGWDKALRIAGLAPRPVAAGATAPGRPRDTWTLARCIESLAAALDEAERVEPGAKLTQPVYARVMAGNPDAAPMSAIIRCAANHGTTFNKLRDELISWRVSGRKGEPHVLLKARAIDELPPASRPAKQAARERTEERRRQRLGEEMQEPWAHELLALLTDRGEPMPMKKVLTATGWERNDAVRRMRKLEEAGLVVRVNHGTSRRTVQWQAASTR